MQKTRIGLIGCGNWGKNILRDLVSFGCEVHVAEHGKENRANAQIAGAHATYYDQQTLPDNLDAYLIATQAATHMHVLSQIVPLGKPIYCEKPLCLSSAEARELSKTAGNLIFVMHKWRYHPVIEKIKQIIDENSMGKVMGITSRRQQWSQPHLDSDAIWNMLPHDLSIILHLIDYLPVPIAAFGHLNDQGGLSKIVGFLGPEPLCQIEVSECWLSPDKGLHVLLENGAIYLENPMSEHILVREGKPCQNKEVKKVPVSAGNPLSDQLKQFVQHLHGGPPPLSDLADAIHILETIETLRSMARNGK